MAAYLRNQIPSHANENNKTPFECWSGRKPIIRHLRVIWANAYAHISKSKQTSKISTKVTLLKLVGYDVNKKAYCLWNLTQRRIEVYRDIIFNESVIFKQMEVNNFSVNNLSINNEKYE